jgi:hypothetical protein
MTRFAWFGLVALGVVASGSPALGFNCPVAIMQAETLIKKAETKVTAETRGLVDEARKMLAEARAHHEGAKTRRDHADAIRKAKVASAFAEEAITLQTPGP